jgi:hypothetical protein
VSPEQLEQIKARLQAMPPLPRTDDNYQTRELVECLFDGISDLLDNGYSWEKVAQWFRQEFPTVPAAPTTLRDHWRRIKNQKQSPKKKRQGKSSRSQTQPTQSQTAIAIPSQPTQAMLPSPIFEPQAKPPEVKPIEVVASVPLEAETTVAEAETLAVQPLPLRPGQWSQAEMRKHFNSY